LPNSPPNIYSVVVEFVWPVRPNVSEHTTSFIRADISFQCAMSFPNLYEVNSGVILNGTTWSQVRLAWEQPFQGDAGSFIEWCTKPEGTERILLIAEGAQNYLIDFLKETSPNNPDLACIRHFGPVDWPLRRVTVGGTNIHLQINDSVGSQFRSQKSALVPPGITISNIGFTQRSLRRAADLIASGYPTEGALICIAVLDAYVQNYLSTTMGKRGVGKDAAEGLLRNTTTKRLTTYLDPVLKLATTHSMQEDAPTLFKGLGEINFLRNEAIHNGRDLTRKEGGRFLSVVRSVITYLEGIPT
jgi:hypothetical protein